MHLFARSCTALALGLAFASALASGAPAGQADKDQVVRPTFEIGRAHV